MTNAHRTAEMFDASWSAPAYVPFVYGWRRFFIGTKEILNFDNRNGFDSFTSGSGSGSSSGAGAGAGGREDCR